MANKPTRFYYQENETEILDRQIEHYRHNVNLAEKFIRGVGVATALSTLSIIGSVATRKSALVDLFDFLVGLISSDSALEEVTTQLAIFSGAFLLSAAVLLFLVCISNLWGIVKKGPPEPLLGEQVAKKKKYVLLPDTYDTEMKEYITTNSKLLHEQNELFEQAYSIASIATNILVVGLVLSVSPFIFEAQTIGTFNFIIVFIISFSFFFSISLGIIMSTVSSFRSKNINFTHEVADWYRTTFPNINWLDSTMAVTSLCLALLSFSLVLLSSLVWWENNLQTRTEDFLGQFGLSLPQFIANNPFVSIALFAMLFALITVLGLYALPSWLGMKSDKN